MRVIVVNVSVSGIFEELIKFPVSGGFQEFSSSFNPIAFIPNVFSGILKVFQEDVPLSDVLSTIGCLGFSEVLCVN